MIDPFTYEWSLEGSGPVGNGKTVLLSDLPVGTHTLNLTVSGGANPAGTDQVQFVVSDGYANLSTPVAVDDLASTAEETPVEVAALANDLDPNGDPLTITTVGAAANGQTALTEGGSGVRYTPEVDFSGTDVFSYTIADGNDNTAHGQILVEVTGVNDAPIASDDVAITFVDTVATIGVLTNDFDADGDPLQVIAVEDAAHGSNSTGGRHSDVSAGRRV